MNADPHGTCLTGRCHFPSVSFFWLGGSLPMVLGVPSSFFPGIFLSKTPQETGGFLKEAWLRKKNGWNGGVFPLGTGPRMD